MAKRKSILGIIAVLVLGIAVVGCDDGGGYVYVNEIVISVGGSYILDWQTSFAAEDEDTTISGVVHVFFAPAIGGGHIINTATVTVDDLQWLTAGSVSFSYSGAGNRTLSVNSVEIQSFGSNVRVTLNVTRSAAPGSALNRGTATISIALPHAFESRYEVIRWGNRTFQF
ncbi:MAG: hypothetical protein FWC64_06755 [Treponema sp.]|nr:hypothetical protein [Treponema sp.]